jgi:hypothetical protein
MSASDIQEKIAAARREAETLKEKIRAKREQLADTSRKYTFHGICRKSWRPGGAAWRSAGGVAVRAAG